jgi:tRNA pseudouridine synthase 10
MEGDRVSKDDADDTILTELSPSSRYARMSPGKEREDEECWVCLGLFDNLDVWAERAAAALEGFEYSTFLVGTKMSGLLSENEEILWTESGATHAEPFKSELNREVGKLIAAKVGKEVEFKQPDILVTLNLAKEEIFRSGRSIFREGIANLFVASHRQGGHVANVRAGAVRSAMAQVSSILSLWTNWSVSLS